VLFIRDALLSAECLYHENIHAAADIMRIPEMEILKTRCLMTVIGGEIVYEAK